MPETTLQPAAAAGIDTEIDQVNAATNSGTDTVITWGFHSSGNNKDLLFKFDLSSIPKGSVIQQAKLSLYVEGDIGSSVPNTAIQRILSGNSDWTEGGATWNTKDGTNNWAGSAGCETVGTDIATTYLYGPTNVALSTPQLVEFDLNANDFQALIDVGNYGFKLGSTNRSGSVDRRGDVRASDHATSSDRPVLYVRWLEPSGQLHTYSFNVYDPMKRIIDDKGRNVQPSEIRPDNWIKLEGIELPGSDTYTTLVDDPRYSYIVGVEYDENGDALVIKSDRNQFADQLLKRLTRQA